MEEIVEKKDDGEVQLTFSGCTAYPYKVCHCFIILSAFLWHMTNILITPLYWHLSPGTVNYQYINMYIQSFTGPCNTPTQCNTGAIELAVDTHFYFFDCNNVCYYPNIVCMQFWAITHLYAQVMKGFSNKFAVFSCFWNLLGHFWPYKYSTSTVHAALVHYRYGDTYKLLECARIFVEIDGFVASNTH